MSGFQKIIRPLNLYQECFNMNFDKYFDIPFLLRGRCFKGADCYGLVRLILLHEFEIKLPLWEGDYTTVKDHNKLNDCISAHYGDFKEVHEPMGGDVILMRLGGVFPVHIGVMISKNTFIHTREDENVTSCKISDAKWNRRIVGFYKYVKKT